MPVHSFHTISHKTPAKARREPLSTPLVPAAFLALKTCTAAPTTKLGNFPPLEISEFSEWPFRLDSRQQFSYPTSFTTSSSARRSSRRSPNYLLPILAPASFPPGYGGNVAAAGRATPSTRRTGDEAQLYVLLPTKSRSRRWTGYARSTAAAAISRVPIGSYNSGITADGRTSSPCSASASMRPGSV